MTKKLLPLLPYEKFLASQLGVSEQQYQEFKAQQVHWAVTRPATGIKAGFIVPILINAVIGIGLSLISALLFPPDKQKQSRVKAKQEGGENLSSNQRASPRQGFSALQSPASIGQLVPVVIAKRENDLGGVRVNFPLIWSQLMSLRGSQMFRGIFLAGAGSMPADAWDNRGWAFGNNTLGAYSFFGAADTEGGRFSLYYRGDGARIEGTDLLAGRRADKDIGNAENSGGPDVYSLRLKGDAFERAFCMVETPATSTSFGLYGWCPNAMLYRAPITLRPTISARPSQLDEVYADDDPRALCDVWKAKYHWSCRGGLIELNDASPATGEFEIVSQALVEGDRIRYKLANNTDTRTAIKFDDTNSQIESNKAQAKLDLTAVGAGVAGIQVSADNALIPGELYRVGSAWAVLENRISQNAGETVFISDQDEEPPGNGNTMEYVFIVVKAGTAEFVSPEFLNPPEQGDTLLPPQYDPATDLADLPTGWEGRYRVCSGAAQIFRMGLASVASVREVRVMEVGFRSRVGIRVNGMTEYRSCPKIMDINAEAGQNQVGDPAPDVISVSIFQSNQLSTRIKRYSTFEMWYRGSSGNWTQFDEIFAIAGNNEQDFYNYLRIEFATDDRWEVRFEPVSSWEVRTSGATTMLVLDSTGDSESASSGGTTVRTTGYRRNPTIGKTRRIQQLDPEFDLGLGWSDFDGSSTIGDPTTEAYNSMLDGYGHFAEAFCYDNVQSSVGEQPEHQIVYVNYPDTSGREPNYQCLATIGMNLIASLEFQNLQQFSGYCINGYQMRQLLAADEVGSSHLFPDWLREMMTSNRVGPLPPLPDTQIDQASFQTAAQWCQDRKYYYDAVETEPLNILQWASDIAQAHLLKLVRIGGRYHLQPAINFDTALEVEAMFTNGNILEGTFRLETVDFEARQPIIVQATWREETTDVQAPLFPRERSVTVREATTPINAPVEPLQLASWCTNFHQAVDAACYLIRFRQLAEHRVSFQTTPDLLCVALSVGSIIKVAVDVISYDTAVQGVITADGVLVTTRPDLAPTADGSYPALLWGGGNDPATPGNVVITGGVAAPANSFFALENTDSSTRTYEISSLSMGQDGVISIEAFHHPVNESGLSELGQNWTTYETDSNWVLEL